MPTPKRKAARGTTRRKGKITIKESASIRKKGIEMQNKDTVPIKKSIPDNAVTFKVKIKRKR